MTKIKPMIKKLIMSRRLTRVLCIAIVFTLAIGGFSNSSAIVSAKQNYDRIETEQKLLVMMLGDEYKLQVLGYCSSGFLSSVDYISNVTWNSSDTGVATIDKKGKIKAKKSGKCIITATYGKKSAKCKLRVYTERALYEQVLEADMSHDIIYTALTTDKFPDYDILYYNEGIKSIATQREKAAKKIKKILASVIKDDMSDYEKMMVLAGWIVNNIKVDDEYLSEFTYNWLDGSDIEYYYMDALLYGTTTKSGVAYLFQLLVNTCGIKCERTEGSLDYKTEDDYVTVIGSNVINLSGNYYYFDFARLAEDLADYNYEHKEKYSIYDMIVPDSQTVEDFTGITAYMEREESYKENTQVRFSDYSYFKSDTKSTVSLYTEDGDCVYDCYYYDFYEGSNRFVTPKESDSICLTPTFSTLPVYPDSTSSEYKKPMKALADMNGTINNIVDNLNYLKDCIRTGESVFPDEITQVKEQITTVETQFNNEKETLCDRNAVKYIESKINDTKEKYAILETKYNEINVK